MSKSNAKSTVEWNGDWHTSVPDSLLHSDLSGPAKLLWICIKSFMSPSSPIPWPGRSTLCEMIGISEVKTFKKYRRELEIGGWLERRRNPATGGNLYTLLGGVGVKNTPKGGGKKDTPKDNQARRNTSYDGVATDRSYTMPPPQASSARCDEDDLEMFREVGAI